jgi:outer membrane protein W
MKWWTILIFSFTVTFIFSGIRANGQNLCIRAGIYDFTDNTATEFYTLAPGIYLDYDMISFSRLKINTGLGFAFNAIKYNEHRHYLYFMPVFISMKYEMVNPDSKLKPMIGAGFSLAGNADQNQDFDKTHFAFTYGYHALACLDWQLKEQFSIVFDLRYNLLLNPVMEEINMSGVVSSVGVKLKLK